MNRYIAIILFLFSSYLNAQFKNQTMISIDNPNFRKLVVAIPDISLESKDPLALKYVDQIRAELPFLLQFTGFFKPLDKKAYEDKKKENKAEDQQFWKMLSVDTAINVVLVKNGKLTNVEISGLDVYRGRDLDKKVYLINNENALNEALKRYVDYLLTFYTGKPGIFQSKIVFAGRTGPKAPREIFICDPDGSNVEQITRTKAIHISPSWHPSGEKIIFTSYESNRPTLFVYDLHTKVTSRLGGLASGKGISNSGGKFAPQGKLLAYTEYKEGNGTPSNSGSADIFIAPSPEEKGMRREFIKGNGINVDPIFSPDGKWLAFVSGRYGNPHIFRSELAWNSDYTDIQIKNEQRLTFAGWWNAMPSWSPDSKRIVFAGFDKDINRFDIFIMNNDGTKMERLTLQSGDNKSPSFSPNGQMLVFHSSRVGTASDRGRNQLYVMNQDGTEQRNLATGLYDAEDPKWGPFTGN